jgi:hypothetical protein
MNLQPDPRFFMQIQLPMLNRYPPLSSMSFVSIKPHQLRRIAPHPPPLFASPSRESSHVLHDARINLKRTGKRLESPPKKVRFEDSARPNLNRGFTIKIRGGSTELECVPKKAVEEKGTRLGSSKLSEKEGGGPRLSEAILRCIALLEESISMNERKIVQEETRVTRGLG